MPLFGKPKEIPELKALCYAILQDLARFKQDSAEQRQWLGTVWSWLQEFRLQLAQVQFQIKSNEAKSSVEKGDIEQLKSAIAEIGRGLHSLEAKYKKLISEKELEKKKFIERKVYRKIRKISKDYIKKVIIELGKGGASAAQLKESIVDEQRLCSRSSFYRILGELVREGELAVSTRK